MLHIVQVVLSGVAHPPMLFLDTEKAEKAYVECVRKYWAQSYATHCERNGLSSESFQSAQAFVRTFDLAGTSTINYWSLSPEEIGPAGKTLVSAPEPLAERREEIVRATKDAGELSHTVTEGLVALLDKMTGLTESVAGIEKLLGDGEQAEMPEAETTPLPSLPQPAVPKTGSEKYETPEWKTFVALIRNICSGRESTLFTRHDWRQAVYSNTTPFEYWEWVATRFDDCREKAKSANYTVVPDPDNPGQYRFRTPDGVSGGVSCYTEEEAWCCAGLHREGVEATP